MLLWTTCRSVWICPRMSHRPFLSLSWKSLYATSILSVDSSFITVAFFLLSITGCRMSLNPSTCWQLGILDRTYSATFVSPQLPSAMRIAASHITVSMSKMLLLLVISLPHRQGLNLSLWLKKFAIKWSWDTGSTYVVMPRRLTSLTF